MRHHVPIGRRLARCAHAETGARKVHCVIGCSDGMHPQAESGAEHAPQSTLSDGPAVEAAHLLNGHGPLQDALMHALQALLLCLAPRQHLQQSIQTSCDCQCVLARECSVRHGGTGESEGIQNMLP